MQSPKAFNTFEVMEVLRDTSERRALLLSTLLGVAALIVLLLLSDQVSWSGTDPTAAVIFVLHRVALALTGWVVFSAIVVAWAITGIWGSRFARSLAVFSVPWLRKMAITGLAGGFALSGVIMPTPAVATDENPRPVSRVIDLPQPIQDIIDQAHRDNPVQQPRTVTPRRDDDKRTSEGSAPKPKRAPDTVRVSSGDNLWEIAEREVRRTRDRVPTNAEIARYWVRLVDTNRDSLLSGDPDLIYPGEIIRLPPLRDPTA